MATCRLFTTEFKLKVLDWHHENSNNSHATSRHFKLDRKTVHQWIAMEKKLRGLRGQNRKRRHLIMERRFMSPELDTAVFDYLIEQHAIGRPVSNKNLRSKALELAQSGKFTVTLTFKASAMWLK